MIKQREYALYHGDKFIDIGTIEYLANLLNVKKKTIYFYSTPTYLKRTKDYSNRYIVILLDEEEEMEKNVQ